MRESLSDHLLVDRIRNGDHDAFAELVRRHWRVLFDFGAALTKSPHAAEDLLQNIFLNIWERHATWQPGPSIRAYLFRAVRNRALNLVRDERRRATMGLEPVEAGADTDRPDDDLALGELQSALRKAVEAMPERRQIAYRLSRFYGLTYREIAAVLDIGEETVRSHISAALAGLREQLADYL